MTSTQRIISKMLTIILLLVTHQSLNSQVIAQLIHFTVDGKAGSASLFPGFRHNSCWSGLGRAFNGNIYIAISNHLQPKKSSDGHLTLIVMLLY